MLTGESLAVSKQCERIAEDVVLAERTNMLFKGTAVTRGSGEGVVVATGMSTELGNISALVAEAQPSVAPLERRLDELGRKLLWVTLAVIVLVAAAGIARGKDVVIMIEMAIALAVAAIPEGLPIVATVALARGMIRMARRSALINRLAAVETLGGTSVICTDKTGTLTENRMTVTRIVLSTGEIDLEPPNAIADRFTSDVELPQPTTNQVLLEVLEVAALCNNAFLSGGPEGRLKGVGDPIEVALLVAAANAGIQRKDLNNRLPETREEAFDSDLKMMATFHKDKERYRVAVKGAPEVVLEVCSCVRTDEALQRLDEKTRQWWGRWNAVMAEQGLRVLALATKTAESDRAEPYEDLTLVGLVVMTDPPRDDVRAAIDLCHKAGIKVVMVTGDQSKTAAAIASSVGLVEKGYSQVITSKDIKPISEMTDRERNRFLEASIFARVSPKQKLDLIDIHQQAGSVVAMTGDGVNDAPALKKADIGIAMGQGGTQVAREAADIVLQDDAFSTIVAAVEQGRVIFGNIRKFVLYLLSCNVSEVMIVFLASIVNAPLPILPLQILFLNLVTDVFPALALGVGEGDPEIMNRKPRDPKEPLLTDRQWFAVFGYGMLITLVVLSSFAVALLLLDMSAQEAVTISFLTLAFSQLWHIFNMRDRGTKLFQNEVFQNKYVWAAIVLCSGLLIGAVYLPIVSAALKLTDPGLKGWVLVILSSLAPCFLGQIFKWITRSTRKR